MIKGVMSTLTRSLHKKKKNKLALVAGTSQNTNKGPVGHAYINLHDADGSLLPLLQKKKKETKVWFSYILDGYNRIQMVTMVT